MMCFLNVLDAHTTKNSQIEDAGLRAVVRTFVQPPTKKTTSSIVACGSLSNQFMTYSCDSIASTVAVVRNIDMSGDINDGNSYFVVNNRESWLHEFHSKLAATHL